MSKQASIRRHKLALATTEASTRSRRRSRLVEAHLAHREQLWPEAAKRTWNWSSSKGYVHVPRLLPLVLVLINRISQRGLPGAAYFELWSRCLDGGFLELDDEEAHAYASGCVGQRAVRTWRERVRELRRLGFIEVKPAGNREFGFVLLPNPIQVCVTLRKNAKTRVSEAWWTEFVSRARKIGAVIPD